MKRTAVGSALAMLLVAYGGAPSSQPMTAASGGPTVEPAMDATTASTEQGPAISAVPSPAVAASRQAR
jgi:hypothetical protein